MGSNLQYTLENTRTRSGESCNKSFKSPAARLYEVYVCVYTNYTCNVSFFWMDDLGASMCALCVHGP